MRLPDLEAWAIFATVVAQRSFTAAAAELNLSKATVSKAVSRLEGQLGTKLFHRTSRHLSLTETGRTLADHAARILAEAEAAEEAGRSEAVTLTGLVRVAAPMTFGTAHVAPALADFLSSHPGIAIDLHLSDEKVDLIEHAVDIGLRIAALPDSSLLARRLRPIGTHIVAAPSYLERRGRPRHPVELGDHDCLCYANVPTPGLWRFRGPDDTEVAIRVSGPLRANSGDAMMPALRAGLGIAILPDFIVDEDLASGRIEAILPDWAPPPVALHLVTPPGTPRPARVEALIAFLRTRF